MCCVFINKQQLFFVSLQCGTPSRTQCFMALQQLYLLACCPLFLDLLLPAAAFPETLCTHHAASSWTWRWTEPRAPANETSFYFNPLQDSMAANVP